MWKGKDTRESVGYPGGQCLQVWTQEDLTPGAQFCSLRTLLAWPQTFVNVEEIIGNY